MFVSQKKYDELEHRLELEQVSYRNLKRQYEKLDRENFLNAQQAASLLEENAQLVETIKSLTEGKSGHIRPNLVNKAIEAQRTQRNLELEKKRPL